MFCGMPVVGPEGMDLAAYRAQHEEEIKQEEAEAEVDKAYVSIKGCNTYIFFNILGVICLVLSLIGSMIVSEELSGGAAFAVFVILALNACLYFCLGSIAQKVHEMHIRLGELYNRLLRKETENETDKLDLN
jgi:hypothetical protein